MEKRIYSLFAYKNLEKYHCYEIYIGVVMFKFWQLVT